MVVRPDTAYSAVRARLAAMAEMARARTIEAIAAPDASKTETRVA